jgi:GH35 family endo-1,4-beta-xylanase
MNKVSTMFKAFSLAIAASTFSFAGVGMADGAAKFLGNITTAGEIPDDFGTYWNQITAEYECVWINVEKERGKYDWSGCDLAYNWAKTNNAYFTFHTLLWGSQNPQWLYKLDVDETKKAWTDWIDAVKEHYPDLEMIEVVNEAIKSGNNYHSSFTSSKLVEALGGDDGDYKFVVTAFKMARERWPHAILIYNDYNTILWQVKEGIDLIKKIKAQGAPVDAYGMQFHETTQQGSGYQCLRSTTLKRALHEAHEQTGLPIYITQYDVGDKNDDFQKECYQEHIPLLMETEYVKGITLWGYVYGKTWTTNGNSGLIKDGVDRPAMTWLKEYFNEHFYDSKNMWYEKGIKRHQLDSLDSIALEQPIAIGDNGGRFGGKIRLEQNSLQNYDVFDVQGVRLGKLSAYSFNDASTKLKSASNAKTSGIYFLRNRTTGKMRSIRVAR